MLGFQHGEKRLSLASLFARAEGGCVSVGRAASNTLSLVDQLARPENGTAALALSRRHALLAVHHGALQLRDNNTMNGTFVNGQRVNAETWKVLNDGDIVSLGGPPSTSPPGQPDYQPWTFVVSRLHEFLATNGVPQNACAPPGLRGAYSLAPERRELYTFTARRGVAGPAEAEAEAAQSEQHVIDLTHDDPGNGSPPQVLRPTRWLSRVAEPRLAAGDRRQAPDDQPPALRRRLASDGAPPAAAAERAEPSRGAALAAAALPAAPAAPPAPAPGGAPSGLAAIKEQFSCPICQDLVVPAFAMVPCGHLHCGECLAGWLASKRDCPVCRQKATAPPVRQVGVDGVISTMAAGLEAEEQETRTEKLRQWEQGRVGFELTFNKPWAAPSSGRHRLQAPGVMGAAALGNGNVMQAMMLAMGGMGDMFATSANVRAAAGAQRQRPPPPSRPPTNEYRAEYAQRRPTPCAACPTAISGGALRIGIRQAQQSAHEPPAHWRWHHLACMPPGTMADARFRGVANLRGVSPADQARLRERMQLCDR